MCSFTSRTPPRERGGSWALRSEEEEGSQERGEHKDRASAAGVGETAGFGASVKSRLPLVCGLGRFTLLSQFSSM